MQKNENETSICTCAFCGSDTKYWERVDQVPTAVCKQNFILNHLEAKNGVGLQGNDYICTRHESVIELKYSCFKTSRPFQKGFSYNYVTEGTLCAICEDSISTRRISRMSDGFQDFLLKGAYQRTTRSGTGLSEADSLCSSCYQSYRKKYNKSNEGEIYTPNKRLGSRKRKSLATFTSKMPPAKRSLDASSTITFTNHL